MNHPFDITPFLSEKWMCDKTCRVLYNGTHGFATNKCILIRWPDTDTPASKDVLAIDHLFEKENRKLATLNKFEFKRWKESLPLAYPDCKECLGTRTVEWTYQHHVDEFDCPICKGTGRDVEGKQIPDPRYHFQVGPSWFNHSYIDSILSVMDHHGLSELTGTCSASSRILATQFTIGKYEILIMPVGEPTKFEPLQKSI